MTPRRRLIPFLLAAALLLAAVPAARATDSHAPKGARADWLPDSEWVMSSWLPYDETRLEQLLHTDRGELFHWLDDRRSLGALARERGWPSARRLAWQLLLPRRRSVSPAQLRLLRMRALATLTQPHLARHVLFHVFHTPAIPAAAQQLLGITPSRFRELRSSGASPLRMATTSGKAAEQLTSGLDALLVVRARRAEQTRSSTPEQASRLLQLQRESLQSFLAHTYRTPDEQLTFACSLHVF